MQIRGETVGPLNDLCVAVTPFTPDHQVAVGNRGGDGRRDGRYRELCCGVHYFLSAEQTQNRTSKSRVVRFCVCSGNVGCAHGWWGSRRTIRPLASLSSVPSAAVMLAARKFFLPSTSTMRPWAVNGSSIEVMLR